MHTQTYTAAGAGCTKGCQSFLLCCFSLTCLIQSKTVNKSDRRRKKGKKRRRRERECLLLFTDMNLFMQLHLKLNFLFLSDNIVSGLLSLLKCPRVFCTHTCITYTHVQVRKCSDKSTRALGSIHSTLSAPHIAYLQKRAPACSKYQALLLKSDIFSNAIRTFSEMPQLNEITTEYIYLPA